MISINQLKLLRDGAEVISGFNAEFKAGTVTAIIGPNGSGKSTLLLAIAGDLPIASGSILINGSQVSNYGISELAKLRAVVLQQPIFNLAFTVCEVMAMARSAGSTSKSESQALIELAISELAERKVTELSGGEKQRAAIARALVNEPAVIFADEPTGNLDSKSGLQVMQILQKLNEEGHTIILVTHEKYTAEHAKRILKIKDGEIVSDELVKNRQLAMGASELIK